MLTGRSDVAAQENDRTLEMPERQSLASTRSQMALPNQLCENRVALGAMGKLEVARYLFANQKAKHFKDAIENAFLGPSEDVLQYPTNINVPTPEDNVAAANTVADSSQLPEFNSHLALPSLDTSLQPASLLLPRPCPSSPPTLFSAPCQH